MQYTTNLFRTFRRVDNFSCGTGGLQCEISDLVDLVQQALREATQGCVLVICIMERVLEFLGIELSSKSLLRRREAEGGDIWVYAPSLLDAIFGVVHLRHLFVDFNSQGFRVLEEFVPRFSLALQHGNNFHIGCFLGALVVNVLPHPFGTFIECTRLGIGCFHDLFEVLQHLVCFVGDRKMIRDRWVTYFWFVMFRRCHLFGVLVKTADLHQHAIWEIAHHGNFISGILEGILKLLGIDNTGNLLSLSWKAKSSHVWAGTPSLLHAVFDALDFCEFALDQFPKLSCGCFEHIPFFRLLFKQGNYFGLITVFAVQIVDFLPEPLTVLVEGAGLWICLRHEILKALQHIVRLVDHFQAFAGGRGWNGSH
mmetsp:Transcript_108/g.158  ORF Transcript_108/g.158 Transcript_108/m.158 type:complete len:367 (-) Transcript_108:171-1271(-)